MKIKLLVNRTQHLLDVSPGETLLNALRTLGYFGVKHGCETGECGACAILLDGKLVNSCLLLAAQAQGHRIETIESLGQHPQQGWKTTAGLHPLQAAFVEIGAIQCGYCTPAQILAAKQLLDANPDPTEAEVRAALAGVLCRCTGYVKPVQAVLRAAAILRGESTGWPAGSESLPPGFPAGDMAEPESFSAAPEVGVSAPAEVATRVHVLPKVVTTMQVKPFQVVGKQHLVGCGAPGPGIKRLHRKQRLRVHVVRCCTSGAGRRCSR